MNGTPATAPATASKLMRPRRLADAPGGGGRDARERDRIRGTERLDHRGVELGAGAALELGERRLVAARIRVGALRGDRVVGVADRDDARADRDLLAREPIRVAAAVPALVAEAHEPRDRAQRR